MFRILWNQEIHYLIHKSPSLVPNLSQKNPVHTFTSHFLKIHCNIIIQSTPRYTKLFFLSALPTKIVYVRLLYPILFFKFGLGSSSALLPPGGTVTSVADARGLLYHPRISNPSYSGRQMPLASTTRGSPLAARGGTMGGNCGQMMPGICPQGSLTCHKSATWDR
jgi:hypothetical protein